MSHPVVMLRACSRSLLHRITRCPVRADHSSAGTLNAGSPTARSKRGSGTAHGSRSARRSTRSRGRHSHGTRSFSRAFSRTGATAGPLTAPRATSGRSRASTNLKELEVVSADLKNRARLDGVHGRRSGALFDCDLTVPPPRPDRHGRARAHRRLLESSLPIGSAVVLDDAIRRKLIDLEELPTVRSDGCCPHPGDRCRRCTRRSGRACRATTPATATSRLGRCVHSLPRACRLPSSNTA